MVALGVQQVTVKTVMENTNMLLVGSYNEKNIKEIEFVAETGHFLVK